MATSDRLALEGLLLRQALYSEDVIWTMQADRKPSTIKLYNIIWKVFISWCSAREINPVSASVPQVLDFLQAGLRRGLAHSTL